MSMVMVCELRRRSVTEPDQGSMSIEMVLLAPLLIGFMMLVAAGGRYVDVVGEVEASSRDAARAASLERSAGDAQAAAARIVAVGRPARTRCGPVAVDFRPAATAATVGRVTAELTCSVSFEALGLIGLPGSTTVTAASNAPLDSYRRLP